VMGARRSLSLIYKKAHRWEDAAKLWQDLLAADPHDVFAVEELAKFYEHHTREYGKALKIVRQLLEEALQLSDAEHISLEHRLQRLIYKTSSKWT
jgi:tetratricopeptide (TPR) repeat protein